MPDADLGSSRVHAQVNTLTDPHTIGIGVQLLSRGQLQQKKQEETTWHREGRGSRRLAGKALDEARKNPSPFSFQTLGQQALLGWLGYRKGREYLFTVSQHPAAVWSPLGVLGQRQAPTRVPESSSRSRVRPQEKVCPSS